METQPNIFRVYLLKAHRKYSSSVEVTVAPPRAPSVENSGMGTVIIRMKASFSRKMFARGQETRNKILASMGRNMSFLDSFYIDGFLGSKFRSRGHQ